MARVAAMGAERRPGIPGDLNPDRGRGAVLSLDARLDLGALSLELRVESSARRIAICGASGAGKSSCLRVVAGLERRCRGRVEVLGERWQGEPGPFVPPWSRGVGWVPQDSLLLPHRTVRENLLWAHQGADGGELTRVVELLVIAPLVERRPRNLSGGERQRVALGRALLARPRLLLLDEPLSALDRGHRGRVAQVIDAWARQHGVPLVLVSHDERDVASLADEVWVMEQGRLSRG